MKMGKEDDPNQPRLLNEIELHDAAKFVRATIDRLLEAREGLIRASLDPDVYARARALAAIDEGHHSDEPELDPETADMFEQQDAAAARDALAQEPPDKKRELLEAKLRGLGITSLSALDRPDILAHIEREAREIAHDESTEALPDVVALRDAEIKADQVIEYLYVREAGLSLKTTEVYVDAISAYIDPLGRARESREGNAPSTATKIDFPGGGHIFLNDRLVVNAEQLNTVRSLLEPFQAVTAHCVDELADEQ